jgi:hypothetical protein
MSNCCDIVNENIHLACSNLSLLSGCKRLLNTLFCLEFTVLIAFLAVLEHFKFLVNVGTGALSGYLSSFHCL